jgi:hypothetical protein
MKKILLCTLALVFVGLSVHAQCDKAVKLQASKTQFLNGNNEVQGSKEEHTEVEITQTTIAIMPNGNADEALSGTIKEKSCDWKVPFKEGKMVIKTDLVDPSGDVKQATITIEAKDGKVTLLAEAKERPDQKIRLEADSFEEKTRSK